MKKLFTILFAASLLIQLGSCTKDEGNYPGGTVSPYISIMDLKNLYKGQQLALSKEVLLGSEYLYAVVVSNQQGGNMPEGLVAVQDKRRLSTLRGISLALGADAASYNVGDSVKVKIDKGILTREEGIMQIKGITKADVTVTSTGNNIPYNQVRASDILNNPDNYESTLITLSKATFDPTLPAGTTYAGDKIVNDGFGNISFHTNTTTDYANQALPFMTNLTGVVFGTSAGTMQIRARKGTDIQVLSSVPPKLARIVVTGFLADPRNNTALGTGDANYEYIQLLATENVDFSKTPFALVTTNNAGANIPTGAPVNGWATGNQRTYKINITEGTVAKGQYFYVGSRKNVNGGGSAPITDRFWVSRMVADVAGNDFGNATSNLLANSGNVAGIALFDVLSVDSSSVPVDVIFYGGGGSIFSPGPPTVGYKITNTDYYDIDNTQTFARQPFYSQGSNTGKFGFPTAENFAQLGGTYNVTTKRWTNARALKSIPLLSNGSIGDVEGATTIEE